MTPRLLIPTAAIVLGLLGGALFFAWPTPKHDAPSTPPGVDAPKSAGMGPTATAHSSRPRSPLRESGPSANAGAAAAPYSVEDCTKRLARVPDATTLLVYDHEVGAPITLELVVYCQELIALSPAPDGDLVANFTVSGGHVRADYYLVDRQSASRWRGSLPTSPPTAVKISDEEAQAILAEQTRRGMR